MPRFCTGVYDGHPCTYRAMPGRLFCCGHDPHAFDYQRCAYFNRLGEPCRSLAMRGQDHCFTHSPRNHRARRPAMPLIPRTQRQKAYAKRRIFTYLPHPKTGVPEIPLEQ
ncbi:MAG TPA: hypothetical protein VHZ25_03540 [Acidobacteriaceae bacterium]|nr:hypothetical protein [Acidobacteriaceae bacterium]